MFTHDDGRRPKAIDHLGNSGHLKKNFYNKYFLEIWDLPIVSINN